MIACTLTFVRTRLRLAGLLLLGLSAVSASAQLSDAARSSRCAENHQAIAMLEAQRANGGRVDISMARAEVASMNARYARMQKIEALAATGRLLGGWDANADYELESEKKAIAASALKYNVACGTFYSDSFAAECIRAFERMITEAAAAPPPDRQTLDRLIAAYRGNVTALECDRLAAAEQAAIASRQPPASGCNGFTGKWNTNYGPMWLVANGSSITGFYDWTGSNGPRHDTLSGTISGNVAEGTYSQPGYPNPDYESGRFRFELSGNSFSGTGWSRSGTTGLAWSGTCARQ
jgi:hypothetical protein